MTLFAGIAIAILGLAQTPAVDVSVEVSPSVVPFHRQAAYTIRIEAPSDLDVTIPNMMDKFGGLGVYGTPELKTAKLRGGRKEITQTYILDPVFIGDYSLQPVEVSWGDAPEDKAQVASPGLRVRDLTDEERAEAEQFEAAAGPLEIQRTLARDWRLWAVGLVILAALIGFLIWRQRHRTAVEASKPPVSPWDAAYDRLRSLDMRQLPRAGKFELYYVELSAILREYIEERFQLHAPERTTPEFLMEASASGLLSDAHQKLLAGFLRHCDRVKFAQYRPTLEEMEYGFAQVLKFVDETVPKPEPATAQEEAAA